MLAEIETGLVALLNNSELGKRVRQVDSLPDLEGDSLIGRFLTDAPAIYVALGSFPVASRYARPKYGIACVARNHRSHQAARHGDGVTIGLYEMLDAVMEMIDGASVNYSEEDTVSFEVVSCDQIASEALFQKGVYAAVVQIQSISEIPFAGVTERLADFKTFHADYDIDAQQSSAEHNNWLREPPELGSSAPSVSDTLKLKE